MRLTPGSVERVSGHFPQVREALDAVVAPAHDDGRVIRDDGSRCKHAWRTHPGDGADGRLVDGEVVSRQQVCRESVTSSADRIGFRLHLRLCL